SPCTATTTYERGPMRWWLHPPRTLSRRCGDCAATLSFGRPYPQQESTRPSPSTASRSLPVSCSSSCREAVSVHPTPVWLDHRQNEVSANNCRPRSRLPLTCSRQRP